MIKGGGRHLLLLLAILLILATFVIVTLLFFLQSLGEYNFDELISSAELALQNDSDFEFSRKLLGASRRAVSSSDWMRLLSLAARSIPADPRPSDYRLFTVLAGRAASIMSGNEDFLAYWHWGLLRGGNPSRASKYAQLLSGDKWSSLAAEIRIKTLPRHTDDRIKRFVGGDYESSDPDLFARIALLTESAELSYDAALLYMLNGKPEKAYDIALILMSENSGARRRWSDESLPARRNVYTALAEIALDAGYKDSAISWLSLRLEDTSRRRVVSWQNLELLGELYWEIYSVQAKTEYRDLARDAWSEALEIASSDKENLEDDSWRIWINLSTLEEMTGNIRRSKEILDEALSRFPDRSEVKAAWARRHFDSEPALARRLIRQSVESNDDPILGITAIAIDPEIVSPRLYAARLWELFEIVTTKEQKVHEVDVRIIATFLLEFMSLRKNFSSLDVAIERYLKAHPHETWILAWRLAADSVRKAALIDLIAPKQEEPNPYENFRRAAQLQNSWRLLHDSALFAILASTELDEIARMYPDATDGEFSELLETVALDILERGVDTGRIAGETLVNRIELVGKNRDDLVRRQRDLRAYGRKGLAMQTQAGTALRQEAGVLIQNAFEDLILAEKIGETLSDMDRSKLLYLRAVVLEKIGEDIESRNMAEEAIALDPDNTRAVEFLTRLYDYDQE